MLPDNVKLVIFDFDGTLVDSNPIKYRAFDLCFADFPSHANEIRDYCHNNHHVTRKVKFRYVYETILKKPYTAAIEEDLTARYAAATTKAIIAAPEIPGALDFVLQMKSARKTALLSSTPHEYLSEILNGRNWAPHFDLIQGAPVNKAEWLTAARGRLGLAGYELVFFGDTAEDARSAAAAGCPFIGVANAALASGPFIKDFVSLKEAA